MKISPFQVIVIAVFGLSALVGIFVFSTYSSQRGQDGVGTVVIWGTLPKRDISDALSVAAKAENALKEVSYVEKEAATLPIELATAIATGGAPDLILASQEDLRAIARFITPIPLSTLPARTFDETFAAGSRLFAAPGGAGYFGIPLLVDPLALFVNRPILSSNGIPLPPSTWEGLTGLVPHVANLTAGRRITRGLIALGTYDNVRNARGILSTLFFQAGVPVVTYSDAGPAADLGQKSSQNAPGKAVLGFYAQFADPSKVSYTWNASMPDSRQTFLVGDLGLYLGYISEARYLRAANPNLDFIAVAVPQPATAREKSVYGLMYALMIPNGARNPAGAYQAAALISNNGGQVFAAATGLAPATLQALAVPPDDPTLSLAYAEALYTKGWLSPARERTDAIFSGMINAVTSGRATPDAALSTAEMALGALLQQ
ncbi:extracellular solute-binding protein [Candidatus Kaiserbacteria bacterium]|nr:extracellular solute-binding protein [Candidatus Kaiserbacteria bacterium]